jgi:uncharacterized protein
LTAALPTSRAAVRRFLVQRFALDGLQSGPADVLDALEFVQMDPIHVCGRIHDLIVCARTEPGAGSLESLLYGPARVAFEYRFPNLCALPLEEFRYFVRDMRRREARHRARGVTREERRLEREVLEGMKEGPISASAASRDGRRAVSAWGVQRSLLTHVLDRLWLEGRIAVQRRERFLRWFALPEQVLGEELARLRDDSRLLPSVAEERRFRARKRLRASRVFRPTRADVAALGATSFLELQIDGAGKWYILREDREALLRAADGGGVETTAPEAGRATLLAPLDPLVYDRVRTSEIFGFEYRWEVYTPAARRRWGYYVLPILHDDRLVGRVEPKLASREGRLDVLSLSFEPGEDPDSLAAPLAASLRGMASRLGVHEIVPPASACASLRQALQP